MNLRESKLSSKAERDSFAKQLAKTGEQFVKSSDKFAKELKERNEKFVKGLK